MKITKDSYFLFSGGEVHCKDIQACEPSPIILLDYTMNGLMALAQHNQVWTQNQDTRLRIHDLIIPYFPYARQDRWMAKGESFSLKLYCDMLNSMNFNSVTTWDPHSDVAPALINNCKVITQDYFVGTIIPHYIWNDPNLVFVSPDAGAYKKVSKLTSESDKIAIGTKVRNSAGQIVKTDVHYSFSLVDKTCLIVDDICDGGRTFVELAKALRDKGATKIILYVTHGIFSNGFDDLHEYIDQIYTTDSFSTMSTIPDFMVRSKLL